MFRRLRGLLPALAIAAATCPAAAHAILIDSTPAPLGHVPAGKLALNFRYNSRVDAARSKIVLKGPDGTAQRLAVTASGQDVLQAALTLTPGEYTAYWQVLATDGHITRGTVPFTVDQAK